MNEMEVRSCKADPLVQDSLAVREHRCARCMTQDCTLRFGPPPVSEAPVWGGYVHGDSPWTVKACNQDPDVTDTITARTTRCATCHVPGCVQRWSPHPGVTATTSALDTQVAGGHYKDMAIQPAEFITRNGIGFLEGCVIKRCCRWRKKDGVQDLHKAIHELQLLIELEPTK